jgi:hypothetical protein
MSVIAVTTVVLTGAQAVYKMASQWRRSCVIMIENRTEVALVDEEFHSGYGKVEVGAKGLPDIPPVYNRYNHLDKKLEIATSPGAVAICNSISVKAGGVCVWRIADKDKKFWLLAAVNIGISGGYNKGYARLYKKIPNPKHFWKNSDKWEYSGQIPNQKLDGYTLKADLDEETQAKLHITLSQL